LSQERREGTLGLLFLTDLQAHDVVFGKLAAKAIVPFFCGLSLLPALAICVVVGGVTGGEFWRVFFVTMNALFCALSATILTPIFCQRQRIAYGMALFGLLTLTVILPLGGNLLSIWTRIPVWGHLAGLLTPTGSYLLAFDKSYQMAPGWYWGSMIASHFLGWMFLVLACLVLPRQWKDKAVLPPRKITRERTLFARVNKHKRLRDELLAVNPVTWLGTRPNASATLIWSLPLAALVLWLSTDIDPLGNWGSQAGFTALAAVHALFKIWLAADATHAFSADRKTGALELLLGTRLSVRNFGGNFVEAEVFHTLRS